MNVPRLLIFALYSAFAIRRATFLPAAKGLHCSAPAAILMARSASLMTSPETSCTPYRAKPGYSGAHGPTSVIFSAFRESASIRGRDLSTSPLAFR